VFPVNDNCIQYCTDNQLTIHFYIMTIHVTTLSMYVTIHWPHYLRWHFS